jgi:NitT/TauT family transport system substrate-binding protein
MGSRFWLLVWVAALGCSSAQQPLRVGTNIWPGYEPLYLAQSQARFDPQQIELVRFPSTAEVIRAYRYGRLDVAATTADEALTLVETLPDQRIFLVCDTSNGADALLSRPELPSLEALRGHRIGYEPNALGAYMLARALERANMSLSDVVTVPVQLEEHERAYVDKTVDAVVTFEPRRTHLLAQGARVIFDSSQIPGEIVDVLLTRKESMRAHAPALRGLVHAWFEALDYMKQHPREAADLAAERQRLKPDAFIAALQQLALPDRAANLRMLGHSQGSLEPGLRKLSEVMLQYNLLSHSVDSTGLLDESVVRAVPP